VGGKIRLVPLSYANCPEYRTFNCISLSLSLPSNVSKEF